MQLLIKTKGFDGSNAMSKNHLVIDVNLPGENVTDMKESTMLGTLGIICESYNTSPKSYHRYPC